MITSGPALYNMTAYNTGSNAELADFLPVGPTGPAATLVPVFCLDLGDPLPPGTVIRASVELEVTNDPAYVPGKYRILTGIAVKLVDTPTSTSGTQITESNSFNLTQEMHHGVLAKSGNLILPSGSPKQFVVAVAWAKAASSSSPWLASDRLKVEQGYGLLSAEVFTEA